ncbi:MAG: metal ABC transporter permease [Planctomycetota bacterium]
MSAVIWQGAPWQTQFWQLDAAPLAALAMSSVTLAALGCFLVLRRQAMLGDALAHAVLPGLVVAWLATGSRGPLAMFLGALAAGFVTSALVTLVTRYGRVERGAALGVVFTGLFALGVLLIETTGARSVDLDVNCVLSGQLELLLWPRVQGARDLLTAAAWADLPHSVPALLAVLGLAAAFLIGAWRPLALATFDPRFAATIGARPGLVGAALYALVTLAVVASFEAVGSILVVGLLVTPAATLQVAGGAARANLPAFVARAAGLGLATALLGYGVATQVAPRLGLGSLDVAGAVTALGGLGLAAAALWRRGHSR